MINEENLNKLYNGVLDGVELTTKELNGFGFNSKDLNELIEKGSIIRVKRGLYSLKSVDELFYYGKKLISLKEYDKATNCFKKCFELDSTHAGVSFQLFLRCIEDKDYKKAFQYFDIFFNGKNEFYNTDSNFYLYLLSMITDLPEKHREYAKFLKFEDIRIDYKDKRYKNIDLLNKVRLSVFNQKFIFAAKQLNEIIAEKGDFSVQDLMARTLISQAIEVQIQNKNNIINLIKEKRYEDIIEFYSKMESSHHLSISDNYTLILTKELLNIINSKTIPKIQVITTNNYFEAIDGRNFELAFSLINERNKKLNINNDNNTLLLLLNEIVNKCKELKKNETQKTVSNTLDTKEDTKEIIKPSINPGASFTDLVKFLMKGDLDNSFKTLRNYLKSINKSEYEFLIVDLIKISLLEKDIAFIKPMTAITFISRENYSFDIANYIQEFYINLSQNKFEEARIYLDIISKGNKLGQECVITDGLYLILESSEKMVDYKKDNKDVEMLEKSIEDSKKDDVIEDKEEDKIVEETSVVEPIEQDTNKNLKNNEVYKDHDNELVYRSYQSLLKNRGIILLKVMKKDRIDNILRIVKDYPDIVAFVIGNDNNQQIVLRYKHKNSLYIDYKEILNKCDIAFKEKKYDECIEYDLELLEHMDYPKSKLYFNLGMAYLKKYQIQLAIDYITVANDLAKKENNGRDYSDLILSLKGIIEKTDTKPNFKMTEDEFKYKDISDYYGIDNFIEINNYINESGINIESACEKFGLDIEKNEIIKLIYAREYYRQGNYEIGDAFLKSVEKSKNKTDKIKKIFDEIRKNKLFYHNRQSDNIIKLTLIPNKK